MSGSQKLSLSQKQIQKLSPQQIQLMKLIQIPIALLEQRIKQEIEENPVLEVDDFGSELTLNEDPSIVKEQDDNEEFDDIIQDYDFDEFSGNIKSEQEYLDTDNQEVNSVQDIYESDFQERFYDSEDNDDNSYKYNANNYSHDDQTTFAPYSVKKTFQEQLYEQLGTITLTDIQTSIAKIIIGNIDDSGYLERDVIDIVNDLSFYYNINVEKTEVDEVLHLIQGFEPLGIGARNLKECLTIQLKNKDQEKQSIEDALKIINLCYEEFTKKHYDKIRKKLDIDEHNLKEAIDEILKLNPKPGNSLAETNYSDSLYIIPDFIVNYSDGEFDITLNSKNSPDLKINKKYSEMLEQFSTSKTKNKEAILFIKQKIESARWFIEALNQRQNTLLKTIYAIVDYQKEYFKDGDETKLEPMILKDIALDVDLDISTISRVVSSKFVQTHFGTFSLKKFFSESLSTDSGEEVSTNKIKKILQDCINNEDKSSPLPDEQLVILLKQKGFNIARRTVAKYRDVLGIPVARLRKEL
ncbi:MAG: RNA polymerase sigma-54 factor [Bacteroidetes bacterium GWE2_29_8]|nr:MAG: RNA polymerase sigma-54 factor [Bacteroidetes bacterium GWE2_29_8]OFY19177.1 MAG: RNA polymerase sigma-54 factor [Bacteroidetes bacterium GWF2_29_10]